MSLTDASDLSLKASDSQSSSDTQRSSSTTLLKWEDERRSKVFEGVNVILERSGQGLQENVEVVVSTPTGWSY